MSSAEAARIQDRSRNLTDDENNKLSSHLEKNKLLSLSTAIAQLYLSDAPSHKTWRLKATGILCLVKDFNRHSFFFSVYDLKMNCLWEHELYLPFEYNKLAINFQYFNAGDCIAAFNFCDENEAAKFYEKVSRKVRQRMRKYEQRKNLNKEKENNSKMDSLQDNESQNMKNNSSKTNTSNETKSSVFSFVKSLFYKDKPTVCEITKDLISGPTDFKVVQHIGNYNPTTNSIEMKVNDDDIVAARMKSILAEVKLPINKKTLTFVSSIINEYGVEEFKKEIVKTQKAQQSERPPQQPERPAQQLNNEPTKIMKPKLAPPLPPGEAKAKLTVPTRPAPPPIPSRAKIDNIFISSPPPPPAPPLPPPVPYLQSQVPKQETVAEAITANVASNEKSDLHNSIINFDFHKLGKSKPVETKIEKPIEEEETLEDRLKRELAIWRGKMLYDNDNINEDNNEDDETDEDEFI